MVRSQRKDIGVLEATVRHLKLELRRESSRIAELNSIHSDEPPIEDD
jgi:hypothetical protein